MEDIEMLDGMILDSVFDNLFEGLPPIVSDAFSDFPPVDDAAFASVLEDVDEFTYQVMSFDDDYSCASAPAVPAPAKKQEVQAAPAVKAAPVRRPAPPRAKSSESRGQGSVSVRRGGVEKAPRRYWTDEENEAFKVALKKHGTDINAIAKTLGTRTSTQVRTHIQKYHARLVREYEESKRAAQKVKAVKEGGCASEEQPASSGGASGLSAGPAETSSTYRSESSSQAEGTPAPSEPSCSPVTAEPTRHVAPRTDSVCSISSSCLDAIAAVEAAGACGAAPQQRDDDPTTTPTASPQRLSPTAAAIKLAMPAPGQVIRVSAASRRLAQMLGAGGPAPSGGRLTRN